MVADGEEYGAEEAEDEDEEEGGETAAVDPDAMVDDSELAGAAGEGVAAGEESDDGSEDLEAESSGSEDELEEDEDEVEGEGEGDGMEVDEPEKEKANGHGPAAHVDSVMAH